ncbi:tetratricopeptide repeat protein [Prochlorococcus sp. MIT 0801]|uniref:tetratricopeptide repeat protein n=1 Tax=Prochlorococcus sp. MIT 0801 TaxID=1501269 RepID=UPI0004F915E4|nr:tetratricopeptide repeat protein [Prochlorococcus sp. MIT 0801]AIQ96633.1 TPR repeat [Prochlorococcus sp. MIT 0801]
MAFNKDKENSLARSYIEKGEYQSAKDIYNKLISLNLADHNDYKNLAFIYAKNKDWKNVIVFCKKAITLNKNSYSAWSILGLAFKNQKNYSYAVSAYENAIKIKPDYFDALCNLGLARQYLDDHKGAYKAYSLALEINNKSFILFYNIGNLYYKQGFYNKALDSYMKSLEINDNYSDTYLNLALSNHKLKNNYESISLLKKGLKIDNKNYSIQKALIMFEREICDWSNFNTRRLWLNELGIKGIPISPMGILSMEDSPSRQLIRARRYFDHNFKRKRFSLRLKQHKRIRIGYFSGNFYEHAVSHLLVRVLELHNRDKFKLFSYSLVGSKHDNYTNRIIYASDSYRDVEKLNDLEVAELVVSDEIDIAIDLMGYSDSSRHGIFAYKPAPIQISYLGYPCTTGSEVIDYIIADKNLIPQEYKKYYSEEVIYMPDNYQCNDDTLSISNRTFKVEEFGIYQKSFIFCCFNTNYKIGPVEFDSWMRVLSKIENSILWLIRSNNLVERNIQKESLRRGIDPSRIIFCEPIKLREHMSRQKLANLALDTFNYNSGATAWMYLRSGLPLLTLSGESYASRMATSILKSLDLTYLVAKDINEYEYKAIELANNKQLLNEIKTKINHKIHNSNYFNTNIFTKNLEDKLEDIYYKFINS